MGEPKRSKDACRNCGVDISWERRTDPNEPEKPGDPPRQALIGSVSMSAWEAKDRAWREWKRNSKPRWHGLTQWYHVDKTYPTADMALLCDEKLVEGEVKSWKKPTAKPSHFCSEQLKERGWGAPASYCHRPVTHEKWGVCGMHAKPHLEQERRDKLAEQRKQEQEAIEDSMMVLVRHLEGMGLKARLEGYTGRRSGDLIVPPETITALLRKSDNYKDPASTLEAMEVSEGFNPFIDDDVDEDEEDMEEWIEL